jgi:hypothetical protein
MNPARDTAIKHILYTDPLNLVKLFIKLFGKNITKRLWSKPQTTRSL